MSWILVHLLQCSLMCFLLIYFPENQFSLGIIAFMSIIGPLFYVKTKIKFKVSRRKYILGIIHVFYFILVFFPRGLYLSFNPLENRVGSGLSVFDLNIALVYANLGSFFFLIGYERYRGFKKISKLGKRLFNRSFNSKLLMIVAFLGIIINTIYWLNVFSDSGIPSSIGSQIGTIGIIALLILLFVKKQRGLKINILLLIYSFSMLLLGQRSGLINISLIFLFLFFYNNKRILKTIITIIIVLMFFFPIVSAYKAVSNEVLSYSGTSRLEFGVKIYKELFTSNSMDFEILGNIGDVVKRTGSALDFSALLISKTPEIWNFQYGKTLLYGFLSPIPRAIWKNKPETSLISKFYVDYFGYNKSTVRGGAGYSTFGDMWLNYGILGVIFGMYLYGSFCRLLHCFFISESDIKTTGKNNYGYIYLVFLSSVIVGQAGPFSYIISTMIGKLLIPVSILTIISKPSIRR